MKSDLTFIIVANEAGAGRPEPTMSGGDRIVIELTKNFSKRGIKVKIFTSTSGYYMYKRYLPNFDGFILNNIKLRNSKLWNNIPYIAFYWLRLLGNSMRELLKIKIEGPCIVYSASEYIVDLLPAILLKTRLSAKLIGTFYLFAPPPTANVYKGLRRLRGLSYYLMQQIAFRLAKRFADMVFVNNEDDRWKFIDGRKFTEKNVIAMGPGIDLSLSKFDPQKNKIYDAVFIGRFHPQKGVLELIDIWKLVCESKPKAKLAIIGTGYLEKEIRNKIQKYGLTQNIDILGFKDGKEKIEIFNQSLVVLHPAIYDSGGMAALEAMACGLPGVSFDLPALRTYYPKGMLKTPCYDLKAFAENILKLLNDKELYRRLQREALELAKERDWDKRAEELLQNIIRLTID